MDGKDEGRLLSDFSQNVHLVFMPNRYTIKIVNKPTEGLGSELTGAIVDTLREPIVILDKNLRVVVGSRAF
jgi:hypothetical protein